MTTARATPVESPPSFVRLVAHPVRWRLMQELVRSDRAVRELTDLIDEPQSLVSYHLRHLRDGGLVIARRSSADGRDSYYTVDLERCRRDLHASAGALHPALWPVSAPPARSTKRAAQSVLFLCTGNSARSQMAEALLAHLSHGAISTASAGSNPKPLHPNAVRVMRERDIDIHANRTKHLDEFSDRRFDMVITLCDRVREVCPEFPGAPETVHWSIPDPGAGERTNRSSYPAFKRTAAELEGRITFLIGALADRPTARRSTNADR